MPDLPFKQLHEARVRAQEFRERLSNQEISNAERNWLQHELFNLEATIQQPPVTPPLLTDLIPLACALVYFARRVVGKFDEKRKKKIALALQTRLGSTQYTMDFLMDWISYGLPQVAKYLYTNPEEVRFNLQGEDLRLARLTAPVLLAGSGRRPIQPEQVAEIDRLFPVPTATRLVA